MKTLLVVVHVLACLVTVNFLCVYGQDATCCENCCDDICAAPEPYNVTLDEIAAMQILYVNLFPAIPLFAGIDNLCLTYISLPDSTYLLTLSTVYCNGFNYSQSLIQSEIEPGVFLIGSSTCNAELTVFDYIETGNCSLYLAFLCFNYGECMLAPGNDIPVFGFSNATRISEACYNSALASISREGVDSQDYFIAPFEEDTACTTVLNCTIPED